MTNEFFDKVVSKKALRVKESHMKHIEMLNGKYDLEDFQSLINKFIWTGKSPSYCKNVLITINNYLKCTIPKYKRPFSYFTIIKAYRAANKIATSKNDIYSVDRKDCGKISTIDKTQYSTLRVNMGNAKHLSIEEIYKIHNLCCTKLYEIDPNIFKKFSMYSSPPQAASSSSSLSSSPPPQISQSPTIKALKKKKINDLVEIYTFILLLQYSGMRSGELFQIQWRRDVNEILKNHKILLNTKVGNRYISFGQSARDLLKAYVNFKILSCAISKNSLMNNNPDESGGTGTGGGDIIWSMSYSKMRRQFIKLYHEHVNANKPKGALFHIFRSHFTYVAMQSSTNSANTITQQILNHGSSNMTNRYRHNQTLNDLSLRVDVLKHVEDHFRNGNNGPPQKKCL
uniref:Putative ORF2 n=1 Tax=Drosophila-associated filamentous virus TaxID=2743186 RepID=A0A6M9TZY4_9VIRU|nr:putative ORF2 [Drosophila-associated filamentous virus]